jgi:hypothetical protein
MAQTICKKSVTQETSIYFDFTAPFSNWLFNCIWETLIPILGIILIHPGHFLLYSRLCSPGERP